MKNGFFLANMVRSFNVLRTIRAFFSNIWTKIFGLFVNFKGPNHLSRKSLQRAYENNDIKSIEEILEKCTEKKLLEVLSKTDSAGLGSFQFVSFQISSKPELLRRLVNLISPSRRLLFYKSLKYNGLPYIHMLVNLPWCKPQLDIVMESLLESERYELMNELDDEGNTPLMFQVITGEDAKGVQGFLKYCPPDKVMEYINKVNLSGKTTFEAFILGATDDAIDYLIDLIPKDERRTFFAFHEQGLCGAIIANTYQREATLKRLREEGIELPESYINMTRDELNLLIHEWTNGEKFKEKYGETPWEILNVNKHEDKTVIKKAYLNLMRISHPDKNQNKPSANDNSKKINAAYEFLSKPEKRIQYQ